MSPPTQPASTGKRRSDTRPRSGGGRSRATACPKLANLELALTISIPHVPKPVAVDFGKTLQSIKAGRPPLLISKTADDHSNRTSFGVFDGYLALNDASNLVGDACGFEFGPGAT